MSLRAVFCKACRRAIGLVWQERREHVCAHSFEQPVKPVRLAKNEQVVLLDSPQAVFLYRDVIPANRYDEFARRSEIAEGLLFLVDGRLAAFMWLTWESLCDEGVAPMKHDVILAPGEAYVFDAYTFDDYRQTRAFFKLAKSILVHMELRGCTCCYIAFSAAHPRWINFYSRLGFKHIGDLSYRRILTQVRQDTSLLDGTKKQQALDVSPEPSKATSQTPAGTVIGSKSAVPA